MDNADVNLNSEDGSFKCKVLICKIYGRPCEKTPVDFILFVGPDKLETGNLFVPCSLSGIHRLNVSFGGKGNIYQAVIFAVENGVAFVTGSIPFCASHDAISTPKLATFLAWPVSDVDVINKMFKRYT